jgi:hypothetical protein
MPNYSIPYAPTSQYQRGSLGELMLRKGEIEAEGLRRGGEITSNAIGSIGSLLGGTLRDYAEQRQAKDAAQAKELAEAPRRAMQQRGLELDIETKEQGLEKGRRDAIESQVLSKMFSGKEPPTQEMIIGVVGPERGIAISKGLDALRPDKQKQYTDQSELLRDALLGVNAVPEPMRPGAYDLARKNLVTRGLITEDMAPAEYSPESFAQLMNFGQEPEAPKDKSYSEAELAYMAAQGDPNAAKAITTLGAEQRRHNMVTESKAGAKRELTPTMEANIVNRLNTQWGAANKTSKELNNQVRLMDAGLSAAEKGDLAQGSQAVLVTFQKILDPTSVVRESEFARSAAGQSLLTRIQGAAEKLVKGGSGVPVTELRKFADLAREAVKAQQADMPGARKRIGAIADRYGIPHELIFEDQPSSQAVPPARTPGAPPTPADKKDPLGIR